MAQASASTAESEGIGGRLASFSAQDWYFKSQTGIIAAWTLISLATITAVAMTGRTENKLGADVKAENAVGGTVLLVTNAGTDAWTDITYTLNGLYIARAAELGPSDHASIPIRRFRKGGAAGKHAPRNLVPQTLGIRCEQGQFETTLNVAPGGIAP
jgi:hypothetical protein